MRRLRPERLHVHFVAGVTPEGPPTPRRYTLTHSDLTGELYLSIGPDYDRRQIAGWYTRLMRDEVLAEWREEEDCPALHVHCHVSGGLIVGSAAWRDAIFQRELPLVLEALRYGDRGLYETQPGLERAPIYVHFHATQARYNRTERWGVPADYAPGTEQVAAGTQVFER
jgi:hypothetical protein